MANPTETRPALVNRVGPAVRTEIVVAPAMPPSPPRRWAGRAVVALVLVAVGFRAAAYLSDRPLWIDEAMLALNLVDRPAAKLLAPLDWNQGAPPGFLLAAKAAVETLGPGERALRLVPFLGSLLGVLGFAWAARRVLSPAAAVLAVGLFAVSPHLVGYAAECKQYATDAAIAVGLFALALPLLDGKGGPARWAGLAAGGAAAVWCSHPAAFVVGGIGAALMAKAAADRDRGRFPAAAAVSACGAASFAALYAVCLRPMGANPYLLDYWAGHFLPLPPKSPGDVVWVADHYFRFFDAPGGLAGTEIRAGGLAAVLAAVGAWALGRERWPVAVALALPAALALVASGVHKYPFCGRLLLFLVPAAVLFVARGAEVVAGAVWAKSPAGAAALLAVLVSAPALEAVQDVSRPDRTERVPEVLAAVRAGWEPGDTLYVYYGAEPAVRFYARTAPFPAGAVAYGSEARRDPGRYREDLAALAGRGRVWVVVSHGHGEEETYLRACAEGIGRCDRTVRAAGAAAYLFDFTRPAGRP